MRLSTTFSIFSLLSSVVFSAPTASSPLEARAISYKTVTDKTVFQAPSTYTTAPGVLYARSAELSDGTLLATWENYSPEPPAVYFPIYASTDGGSTWTLRSKVVDTARGYGLRYQPFLYVLPAAFGGFKAGDVFLAGSSIPSDLSSTHIELYASRDAGKTWSFVSHIADGGKAVPNNGETPVWEPFLLLFKNQLVCFYSDQRDTSAGQKLVHQVSSDGKSWGAVVDDVKYSTYTDRPGMTTVSQLPDGSWMMTYEYGGGPVNGQIPSSYSFPVYYRVSSSPLTFNSAKGQPLVATDGTVPYGSPYNVVTKTGAILVSSGTNSQLFVNHFNKNVAGGIDPKAWKSVSVGERSSYSRSLTLIGSGNWLVVAAGGDLPPSTGNRISVGVKDATKF